MAKFVPNEGLELLADLAVKRLLGDRDANLELGLFVAQGSIAVTSGERG